MRDDAIGFFWCDVVPKPPKKEKELRQPPEATWLADDYLPGLAEAQAFPVHVMTDPELAKAQAAGEELIFDVECYPDYFLAMFVSMTTGWVTFVECVDGEPLDYASRMRLGWIMHNFRTIGFNSLDYDNTMAALALASLTTGQLKQASNELIQENKRPHEVLRARKVRKLKLDCIDIIEVCPLDASLKTYAGRLHAPKMQDLPFHHETVLGPLRRDIVRWYCVNDCVNTAFVVQHQREHLDLRIKLGKQYGLDLRSHSDAQLAEAIIANEIQRFTGMRPKPPGPLSAVGQRYHYKPPAYVHFQSPNLKKMLAEICAAEIVVGPTGYNICPDAVREQKVEIAGRAYTVGMGGLHSKEKRQTLVAGPHLRIIDRDVTGYYPRLILHNRFGPPHLGQMFYVAYQGIVDRREAAKPKLRAMEKAGRAQSVEYETLNAEVGGLKIAANGSFGKTSDPWSIMYAPQQMVQITITGQLSLLMCIEALELSGIPVVSANTDGIVVACPPSKYDHMEAVFAGWEQVTGLKTEETEYSGLYMANVNNYFAVTTDGKVKTKGWYCERGSAQNSVLSKNPDVLVCSDAVQAYLTKRTPLEQTIRACRDMRRFVSVRLVRGGGVKVWGDGRKPEYLGKTVRWYYGQDVPGEIVYAGSGNKVPRSEGAVPCMQLPDYIPNDLDIGWYVAKSEQILRDVGLWDD